MSRLAIGFFGYGENGAYCLKRLLEKRMNVICLILSDREPSKAMASLAKKKNIPTFTFSKSNIPEIIKNLRAAKPNLITVASFPYLLPKTIYSYPRYGTLNVHAGELPKYRGYHPLNWAMIRGEQKIGITIHCIDSGVDSGDILAQQTIPLTLQDDIHSIKKKALQMGARLLIKTIQRVSKAKKKLQGKKQNPAQATFAPKRSWKDGKIDWTKSSRDIMNLVRALRSPYPNAFSMIARKKKIDFNDVYRPKQPGRVLGTFKRYYIVTTGDGVLFVTSKQKLKPGERLV